VARIKHDVMFRVRQVAVPVGRYTTTSVQLSLLECGGTRDEVFYLRLPCLVVVVIGW